MMKGLAAVCFLLAGCDLYFGGDDVQCEGRPKAEPTSPPAYEVRDPETGVCTYGGGGGGGWCEDECGPCYYDEPEPYRDWGACYGECYGLDDYSCIKQPGCYAAYIEDPAADGRAEYWGCWNVAPSGPVRGACTGLGAYECSRHDDCVAVYTGRSDATNTAYEGTKFNRCLFEYANDTPGECDGPVTCDKAAPACPTGSVPGIDGGCYTGFCIPLSQCPQATCESLVSESTCIARPDCTPIYSGSDCTCDMTGCHCQVLTYERCETM